MSAQWKSGPPGTHTAGFWVDEIGTAYWFMRDDLSVGLGFVYSHLDDRGVLTLDETGGPLMVEWREIKMHAAAFPPGEEGE